MKVFFRKHGNTAFYIMLPVFFLILTVAFIQLTPRLSRTAPGDTCQEGEECCTDSGCGEAISEVCVDFTCKGVNIGCPGGGEPGFSPDGQCFCGDDGQVGTPCVVCPLGEVFSSEAVGNCIRICLENESPQLDNCEKLEGGGCSLGGSTAAAPSLALFGFAAANLAWLSFRARRKK